jgi:hypothetical protein
MANEGWRRPQPAGPIALVVVLSLVVAMFVCGGGALGLYLIGGRSGTAAAMPAAATGPATPSGSARPATGQPSSGKAASASPTPSSSPLNPAAIVKGECVANDGTEDIPKLRLTPCAPGSFLVVGRFDGTDDVHQCDTVPGATHNFFYRTDPANLSFVLCLKRQ